MNEDDLNAANELMGEHEHEQLETPQVEATEQATGEHSELAETAEQELAEPTGTGEIEPGGMPHDELIAMLQQATPEERAQIMTEAREAALNQQVAQQLEPYRQQLQDRITAGTLDVDSANELLELKTQATMANLQSEQARALAAQTAQKAALDAFFTQVTSEFPGADVETLKLLSGKGLEANELRSIAARQSAQAKKINEDAIAKYVAAKTADGETFVPVGGSPSRPQGGKVASADDTWGSLLGL